MKYDTVLFDLDGTLLNTLDDLADSVNAVLMKRGYRQRTKEEVMQFIGDGAKMLITRSLPPGTTETEILHCLSMFREIYQANMQNKTRPFDGIPALLKRLKEMGIKTGVVSNKPDEATKAVCRIYFQEDIGAAIGDNIDRKKKPEPDNIYEAMKQLGAVKEKTLYVGDSDTDIDRKSVV
jgi:phosphoglycolate phosphatase